MNKVKVFFVFGKQGSGKSTQAKLLAEHRAIPYFATGDELRRASEQPTEFGDKLKAMMLTGGLVDDETVKSLFIDFISKHDCSNGLVVDGFPRDMAQFEMLETLSQEHDWLVVAIEINISHQVALERIALRKIVVDGKVTTRSDDEPAIVNKRLAVYEQSTVPLIEEFLQKYTLLKIDGEPAIAQVFADVCQKISQLDAN